jgi:RNA polymerase sigma-70 factor, ECF subfamily
MSAAPRTTAEPQDESSSTLGGLLYADPSKARVPESEWALLLERVAASDQQAFQALYERCHRLVYTLALRIARNRETAEELTVDVFHDVWRRAGAYQAADGTVLGWIMNQARSRSIDRLRLEQRKKRRNPHPDEPAWEAPVVQVEDVADLLRQGERLKSALTRLTNAERAAIEAAFFGERSYTEVAAALGEPLGTIKTRIRSALAKLRRALGNGSAAS